MRHPRFLARMLGGLAAAALLAAACQASAQAQRPLTVITATGNPPFEYLDAEGRQAGFDNDLIRALGRVLGRDLDLRSMAFGDMMDTFERHDADALGAVVYTEERAKVMDFTVATHTLNYILLVHKDESRINSERDLMGRTVAVNRRNVVAEHFKRLGIPFQDYESNEACIDALAAGRVDCAVAPRYTWLYLNNLHPYPGLRVLPTEIYPCRRGIGVHKGEAALLAQLNEGLFKLKEDGTLDRLTAQHFGSLEAAEAPLGKVLQRTLAALWTLLLLALAGILALWTWILKRTVRNRTEQLRDALEFQPVPVGISVGKAIVHFNQKFTETYGYTLEDVPDFDRWVEVAYPDPDYRRAALAQWLDDVARAVAGNVSTPAREYTLTCKDGTRKAVVITGRQIGAQFVATFSDITELRRAEEDRSALQAQLQQAQKMESLGSLAGGVAHDMNNVLGAILGLASASLEAQAEGSALRQTFANIIRAAERGGKMVKGLLSFARTSPAETSELDLNALLREVAQLLERTTLARIRVELDLEPGLQPMRGDASALHSALMNLCVNAVDAMPGNGTLSLRTRNVDEGWLEAEVEDTGTGMAREVLDRALDPFFTTKAEGKGTGLGLALVYSTVVAHQGLIDLKSEPGRGTRVRLRFPACVTQGLPPEPPPPDRRPSAGALSVLLVDDDELILSSMEAVLESLGHTSVPAASGEEALDKLQGGLRPDLVIMDMNMPGLGGAGTLPRLRALDPRVPVLLATGRADQTALDLVQAYPHVTLLAKPFSMRDLQKHLEPLGL